MELGLTDKACVVTGAGRGIGAAVVELLEAEGAKVLPVSRTSGFQADVTDPGAAGRIVAECESRFGGVDVLVNNAGTSDVKPLAELTDDDWRMQWDLHVDAPRRLMDAVAPVMAGRGGGRIVNVCSSAGKRPSQTNVAYAVSKAGQLSLSRSYAEAWVGEGVLVNAVAPGPVDGGLWLDEGGMADQLARMRGVTREEVLEAQRAKVPIGRYATPEEIAGIVVVLCSSLASNVVGAAWSVDGGTVATIV